MLPRPGNAISTNSTTSSRPSHPGRAEELIEVGDRSFRGGNFHRAEERYKLAAKSNPANPAPHIHLAQIALIRGEYKASAKSLRDAVATSSRADWMRSAPDIQAMYGEPGDFAKQLARLESYLQTHPGDRDAWFVLGVENFFSGHPQVAADAFLRLSDQRPDEALAAYSHASSLALQQSQVEFTESKN